MARRVSNTTVTYTFSVEEVAAALKLQIAEIFGEDADGAKVKFPLRTVPVADVRDPPSYEVYEVKVTIVKE